MLIKRAYKTELDLTTAQRQACVQHAGAARWAYNWGLAERVAAYERGEQAPNAIALHRKLNQLKKTDVPWMYNVSKCAPQEALRNLDAAYQNSFRRVALKKQGLLQGKVGFPRPKTKKRGLGSFRLTGTIRVGERHIQLPRLGKLRLKERGYLPVEAAECSRGTPEVKVLSATVSEKAGRWFVAVQVEQTIPDPEPSDKPVAGVDLGLTALATVSDGTVIENPRPLKTALRQVKRLQRRVSRRKPGGANRKKARERLARAHARVANIRRETLHQATTRLTKTKSVIVVEDLNVSGMQKNHRLALAIADVGWAEFKRQLIYKAAWRGGQVVLADRFYPSSKLCHACGHKLGELALDVRHWTCPGCGTDHDRDLNATKNLEQWVTRKRTASSAGSDACGAEKPMFDPLRVNRCSALKQEPMIVSS
jgi:putative transposase